MKGTWLFKIYSSLERESGKIINGMTVISKTNIVTLQALPALMLLSFRFSFLHALSEHNLIYI